MGDNRPAEDRPMLKNSDDGKELSSKESNQKSQSPTEHQKNDPASMNASPSKRILDSMQKDKYYSINIIRKTFKKQGNSFKQISNEKSRLDSAIKPTHVS